MFSVILRNQIAVAGMSDHVPNRWHRIDCRPLVDGPGNSPGVVEQILESGLREISNGTPICFVCDYGHSRSNLLAALAISRQTGQELDLSMKLVSDRHPESRIKPSLLLGLDGVGVVSSQVEQRVQTFGITGANGLIGSALSVELASRKENVEGFSRELFEDYLRSGPEFRELLKAKGVTDLVHLAYPQPFNSYSSTQLALSQLVNVVEACLDAKTRLHLISGWIVFDGSLEQYVDEDSEPMPHSLYGQAKLLQEQFVEMQRKHQGLMSTTYRLPGLLSQSSMQPRFLRYFADCITFGTNLVTHRFTNGSSTVPLAVLEDFVPEMADAILATDPEVSIMHLVEQTQCSTAAEIASRLSALHDLPAIEVPVDRMTFTGVFGSKYDRQAKNEMLESNSESNAVEFVERMLK